MLVFVTGVMLTKERLGLPVASVRLGSPDLPSSEMGPNGSWWLQGVFLFKDVLLCSEGGSLILTVSELGRINEVSLSLLFASQVSFFLTLPWFGGMAWDLFVG